MELLWQSAVKSLGVAVFYGTCSLSMNFLNKAVLNSYEYNHPFFIMACQMLVTVICVDILRMSGAISVKPYTFEDGKQFLPASMWFGLHTSLSLTALHGMNIPMYSAIKRCVPLVNLVLSVYVLKKPYPSTLLSLSIGIITVGCLVAGLGDLQFSSFAYSMAVMAVFAQAGYLTLIQLNSEVNNRSAIEMIYLNGYNTLPLFVILTATLEDPIKLIKMLPSADYDFHFLFWTMILSGGILIYSQFLCTTVCSALSTSLVGVAKSALGTVIGFFAFGGVPFHPLNVFGLVLNVLGGVVFSYVKYNEQSKKKVTERV